MDSVSIIARLGLDSRDFQAGLASATQSVGSFSSTLLGMPNLGSILSVAGLAAEAAQILSMADDIQRLSDRYGVSTTILQQWGNAAAQNGSSMESLGSAFNKLEVSKDRALNGDEALVQSFSRLGISVNDLVNLSPDELMKKIASSSMNAGDMVKVMGKNATELRPVLEGIAAGTIKFGDAISAIDIKKLADAEAFLKSAGQELEILGAEKLSDLVTQFTSLKDIGVGAWTAITNAATLNFSKSLAGLKQIGTGITDAFKGALDFFGVPGTQDRKSVV